MLHYNPLVLPKVKRAMAQPISPGASVLATGGPKLGLVVIPGDVTFYAPLSINTMDYASRVQQSFVRSSAAIYTRSGQLKPSNINASRHESLGLLVEPASTNKCTNWNANPDVGLDNTFKSGDPASVFSRKLAVDAIRASGLQHICTDGYVLSLDNTAGSAPAYLQVTGSTGNTNIHSVSCYAMLAQGTGNTTMGFHDAVGSSFSLGNSVFERIVHIGTPGSVDSRFYIWADAGQETLCILNQLEEWPNPTSLMITKGSASSRAVDQLQWDTLNTTVLNQTQGMAAVTWRPGFANTDLPNDTRHTLLGLQNDNTINVLIGAATGATGDPIFRTRDGTTAADVQVPWQAGNEYVAAVRWTTAASPRQIGVKTGGVWVWSTVQAYDGAQPTDDIVSLAGFPIAGPGHYRDAYMWAEDKGTAWLEAFYAEVAN